MKLVPKSSPDVDTTEVSSLTRYVRVRQIVNDKFVEFDFAIGDPSLYVELVLPKEAAAADNAHPSQSVIQSAPMQSMRTINGASCCPNVTKIPWRAR